MKKFKLAFLFFASLLIVQTSMGQTMHATMYDTRAKEVLNVFETVNGGAWLGIGGSTISMLLEIDSLGDTIRSAAYDGLRPHHLIQTNDQGFLFIGGEGSSSNEIPSLLKVDSSLNINWGLSILDPDSINNSIYDVKRCTDGYLVHMNDFSNATPAATVLFKTDDQGQVSWAKRHLFSTWDFTEVSNGHTILALASVVPTDEVVLIELDNNGDLFSERTINLPDDLDDITGIWPVGDGGLLLQVKVQTQTSIQTITVKLDANFQIAWSRSFENWNHLILGDIVENADGTFFQTGIPFTEGQLIKFSSDGDFIWGKKQPNLLGHFCKTMPSGSTCWGGRILDVEIPGNPSAQGPYLFRSETPGWESDCNQDSLTMVDSSVVVSIDTGSTFNYSSSNRPVSFVSNPNLSKRPGGLNPYYQQCLPDTTTDSDTSDTITTNVPEIARSSFSLFPNPTSSTTQITGAELWASSFKVINSLGQTVLASTFQSPKQRFTIPSERLFPGVYLILLQETGGKPHVLRFIKK